MNHQFDPSVYLEAIPKDPVSEIHLAGYSESGDLLIDTHSKKVSDPVWDLYEQAVDRFGNIPTLIEWDEDLPEFDVLENEAHKAALYLERPNDRPQPSRPTALA